MLIDQIELRLSQEMLQSRRLMMWGQSMPMADVGSLQGAAVLSR